MVKPLIADQPVGGAGQLIEAEDVDHDLDHREHAGLDHRHRVQQRGNRRRRHHRGGQPAVEGHQRRLADAEHEQGQQHRHRAAVHAGRQDAAALKSVVPAMCQT
jgi:hypothetical protein